MTKKNITKEYLETAVKLITGHDVAICMTLLKIARAKFGDPKPDTYIDASAYMSIAGECKERENED